MLARLVTIALCGLVLSADVACAHRRLPDTIRSLFGSERRDSDSRVGALVKRTADGNYPIYSKLFTGTNNPLHMTVVELVARGAKPMDHRLADNLWSQGYYREDPFNYPIYPSDSGSPKIVVQCRFYGNCNTQDIALHIPPGAAQALKGDHHISIVDRSQQFEFDGWGGASAYGGGTCSLDETLNCSWGGFYPLRGKGLTNDGRAGNHAGFAMGLFAITAQELLQGRISHALGIDTECLDDPSVYPADTKNASDRTCAKANEPQPAPTYGMLIHLRSSYNVAASSYSAGCKTILTAFQTYGAYPYDTGNRGLLIATEDPDTYADPNPWFTKIFPEMAAAGDAWGSGASWQYTSCLNHLSADDLEVYTVPNLGY